MSPSTTEMLYALGLGDRVVGVTDQCNYPPEARGKARIGGYYDPSFEAIVALRPDLVICMKEHATAPARFRSLGLECFMADASDVPSILRTIRALGDLCGAPERARAVTGRMESEMAAVHAAARGRSRCRALVSVGRGMGTGRIQDVYVAGRKTIYGELLELAGGENAYDGAIDYAAISEEGLIRLNPDVIIDLIPDLDKSTNVTRAAVLAEWSTVQHLDAARKAHVFVFGGDYVCIPGPRVTLVLKDMAGALAACGVEAAP